MPTVNEPNPGPEATPTRTSRRTTWTLLVLLCAVVGAPLPSGAGVIAPTSHGSSHDLVFDDAGRLLAEFRADFASHVVEYDPVTLAVLNENVVTPTRLTGFDPTDTTRTQE